MSTAPSTLYERLGRHDGITRIIGDMIAAHLRNPVIKPRFENVKDLDHAARMGVQFLCAGSGGPEAYTGKDLLAAHKGMNISEQEFLAVMDDIVGALEKNEVDATTRSEVVGILYSLKGQVVRV